MISKSRITVLVISASLLILLLVILSSALNPPESMSLPMGSVYSPPISKVKKDLLDSFMNITLEKLKEDREYSLKYLNFTRWLGETYGLAYDELFWTKEELVKIMEKAKQLDEEAADWLKQVNATFIVAFNLPPDTNLSYANMMADLISKYAPNFKAVKVQILYIIDRYKVKYKEGSMDLYLSIIRAFLQRNLSIRVKTIEPYGIGSVEITPADLDKLTPQYLEKALDATEEAAKGEKPKLPNYKSAWECEQWYQGPVTVYNTNFHWKWWF